MWHLWLFLVLALLAPRGRTLICTRRPPNTSSPKSPVDENYVISIAGNPETYIAGQEYNVSLNAFNGHRYISFILALESENGYYMSDVGSFQLTNLIETRFSPNCINMVENTNTNPKTHMHLTWTAPSGPGSGCILIRATVLQHREVWYMDDGGLTRRICEEVVDDVESQPMDSSLNTPCCACDEARYELTFEGSWSRNLHPKDFPDRGWETRFCELVGAAHSADYRFWEPEALASKGFKLYAEHCTSRLLDHEFSINSRVNQKIRTIIKARGPAFPNHNSKTSASVRVDPEHHMVSFATKIEPSPDWILGVSGLELCLRNCTWLENKVINLYPWDVGTDAGPRYTSPDQPQVPPDVIRRIRSDFPNDPRSPFYDESGEPMKPMATLTIRRQRLYERRCLDEDCKFNSLKLRKWSQLCVLPSAANNDPELPRECVTHPWSGWSECTTKCGEGMQYRRRVYKQPELARIYSCNVLLYEERACEGEACGLSEPARIVPDYDEFSLGLGLGMGMGRGTGRGTGLQQTGTYSHRAECQLSTWSAWGPCSVTCGEGYQTRQREYLNPGAELKCQGVHRTELQQTRRCAGRACLGNLPDQDADSRFEEPQPEEEPQPYNRNYNNNEEEPTDDDRRASPFDVGNLKGVSSQWDQDQKPDTQWSANRMAKQRQPDFNRVRNYGQLPRLEDAERSPWQRRRPSESFRQEEEPRQPDIPAERSPWQRNNNLNNYNSNDGADDELTNTNAADIDPYMSMHCFQMLWTVPTCKNETIIGNFWFYNFCTDECMIYTADPCDRNLNKYSRWETCQECRRPEFKQLQLRAAASPECQTIQNLQRAQQEFWKGERKYSHGQDRRRS
ncbi:hypothetical protein KR222_007355 [Zaprionus bogoriensis]|nr:hypothetical protein KR222_007355 [Zaprionus bogoriensis]